MGACTIFSALLGRDVLNIFRNPLLFKARLIQYLFLGIYLGGLCFDNGDKSYLDNLPWRTVTGLYFQLCINAMMSFLTPIALVFPLEREVFLK